MDDVGGFKDTRAPLMLSGSFFPVDTATGVLPDSPHVKQNRADTQTPSLQLQTVF